jgi:hypothetical protein
MASQEKQIPNRIMMGLMTTGIKHEGKSQIVNEALLV